MTATKVRLAPQTGDAFELRAGQSLRIIDPHGEQVSDVVAFSKADTRKWLSSGRTFDYADTIYLTKGHTLYGNDSVPMFVIEEDTVGRHDFLYTPCSKETFEIIYGSGAPHPSCFGNLATALERFGIEPDAIPTTFNVFMNVSVAESGKLSIAAPRSRAGDSILLRAQMDLIVGVTACSAELSNNHAFKPIDIEIGD